MKRIYLLTLIAYMFDRSRRQVPAGADATDYSAKCDELENLLKSLPADNPNVVALEQTFAGTPTVAAAKTAMTKFFAETLTGHANEAALKEIATELVKQHFNNSATFTPLANAIKEAVKIATATTQDMTAFANAFNAIPENERTIAHENGTTITVRLADKENNAPNTTEPVAIESFSVTSAKAATGFAGFLLNFTTIVNGKLIAKSGNVNNTLALSKFLPNLATIVSPKDIAVFENEKLKTLRSKFTPAILASRDSDTAIQNELKKPENNVTLNFLETIVNLTVKEVNQTHTYTIDMTKEITRQNEQLGNNAANKVKTLVNELCAAKGIAVPNEIYVHHSQLVANKENTISIVGVAATLNSQRTALQKALQEIAENTAAAQVATNERNLAISANAAIIQDIDNAFALLEKTPNMSPAKAKTNLNFQFNLNKDQAIMDYITAIVDDSPVLSKA